MPAGEGVGERERGREARRKEARKEGRNEEGRNRRRAVKYEVSLDTIYMARRQVWGTWRLAFCFPGQVWGRLWSGAAALFGLERQSRLREEVNSYQVIDSCVSVTLFLFERSAP